MTTHNFPKHVKKRDHVSMTKLSHLFVHSYKALPRVTNVCVLLTNEVDISVTERSVLLLTKYLF